MRLLVLSYDGVTGEHKMRRLDDEEHKTMRVRLLPEFARFKGTGNCIVGKTIRVSYMDPLVYSPIQVEEDPNAKE